MESTWMNGNGTNEYLERLAAGLKAKAEYCKRIAEHATAEFIKTWAEMGEVLAEARRQFPSDEQFGKWIVSHELDECGERHDRTAMRVIFAHRSEIEKQARRLDSMPRCPQHFLRALNEMREEFDQEPLDAASANHEIELASDGEACSAPHETLYDSEPEVDETPAKSTDSGAADNSAVIPSAVVHEEAHARQPRRRLRAESLKRLPDPVRSALARFSDFDYADVFLVAHYIEQRLLPLYREGLPPRKSGATFP